ncbi:DUF2069 domain-containing protein [Psychrobium sp. nBUS_13]|uniref:DUF2069 domain-containing protein n=1 Tax=Psychrobium sp. nBUS_13 TaxID=3395319 RepID=UPI003EBCDC6D
MRDKTKRVLILGQAGYFGLLIFLPLWHLILVPSEMNKYVTFLLTVGPLLLPLKGILKRQPYTYAWSNFIVMFYLLHGLTLIWDRPDERLYVIVELVLALMMFIGCSYFAKFRGQELGLSIRKKKDETQ